jgi:ketosteroid isomerase-like protein
VPASGITKVSFITKELYGNGDLLTEEGVYSVGDSTKTFETGKYIALWKKVNGQWRVHRDIWNSDGPAPK